SVSLARLREVVERTVELPEEEAGAYHTLGGLVMARLGRIPHAGDEFTFAGLRFEVMGMDRQRVDKVLIQALPEQRSDDLSRNEPDPG
ncbi:MAG TPA: transporter associated domain-containing protein, partial [Burkholderiaceae bacterium]|nr:transporter associated domain-containing protein [Burkholderiaceae bacterium]